MDIYIYIYMYVCMYIMTYESLIPIPILKKKTKREFGQSTLNYSNEIFFLERPNPNDNFVKISQWFVSWDII